MTSIGDYVVERELGRGGMATVYLARDAKHDRRVAIKVLDPELAALLGNERFLREIRVIATLQHPHIVGLIDSGVLAPGGGETGRPYYVMPYIEGESLRARLEREGQLPVGDAVRLAREVAGALDYAHRQGVIHRDIKPENILISDGSALVADFGIALAVQQAGGQRMTETGLSLGTPHYMSPEQAMGERTLTARTDIYALGAVTYEMLAGEPPFTGPNAQAIVARVLSEPPRPLTTMRPSVPPHVQAAVFRAIEKLPADRFSSAAEFAAALASPATTAAMPGAERPTSRAGTSARALAAAPWVVALGAIAVAAFATRPKTGAEAPAVYRFEVALPENAQWVGDILSVMALSPDGTRLVYNGRDTLGERRLYLRTMDRLEPVAVAGSDNGAAPFFSPDGEWIGFRLGTRLVRVNAGGGTPQPICETGSLVRATWLEQDVVVFADAAGLKQCTLAGDTATLVRSDPGDLFRLPHGLPGDRGVLIGVERDGQNRLMVFDLERRRLQDLGVDGMDPRYVSTGHLVYLSPDGLIRVVGFDAERLRVSGDPVVLDDRIPVTFGGAMMALSRDGTIVTAGATEHRVLELVSRSGRAERIHPRVADFADPALSPDGRRIAVVMDEALWLLDLTQGTLTRASSDSPVSRPVWAPDGGRIAYTRQTGPRMDLRVVRADGSAPPDSLPIPRPALEPWEVLFTPDGRSVILRTAGGIGSRDVFYAPLDSAVPARPLLDSRADEIAPALSPDARWMAYVSNESGRAEVLVRAFPDMTGRYQVSRDGGTEPAWSAGGGELFYRSGSSIVAAEVQTAPSFEVVRRAMLFSDPDHVADLTHRVYDVTPDGRFLMVRRLGGTSHLTVTLNRFRSLQ